MKFSRNIAITLVCIILGLMLAWQYRSIDYNEKMRGDDTKRSEDIKTRLLEEIKKNEVLSKKNQEMASKIEEYGKVVTADEQQKLLESQLEEYKMIAGLTDVKGNGIVIVLNTGSDAYSTVSDADLLTVVNELRASDAQAISVNDERIVAMSEIRNAGDFVVINGRQMVAPFTIKAIADPEKLESSLNIVGGVVEQLKIYLTVSLEKKENIVISKVRDDGTVIKIDRLEAVKSK